MARVAEWRGAVSAEFGSTFGVFIMVLLRLLTGAFVAASAAAYAQSSVSPTNAAAETKLNYQSAFSDYRPFAEIEIVPWKRANGSVATPGEHMGTMRDPTPEIGTKPMPMPTAPKTAPASQATPPTMTAPK